MGLTALLALVGGAALLIWGIKGSIGKQGILKSKRIVKILLTTYALILIASVFIFEMLPKNENVFIQAQTEKQLDKETGRIDDAIFNGRTDEVDPDMVRKEWKWEYSGKVLHVSQNGEWMGGPVIVERKSENDGLIEGTYYASSVMGGIDFTETTVNRDVKLEEDTLRLMANWNEKQFKFTIFENEFVINQFNGEQTKGGFEFPGHREIDYLYLKVPKDLKLKPENEDVFIHYVGEDE